MKRILTFMVVVMTTISLHSQTANAPEFRFGIVSYERILQELPEYMQIDEDMAQIKAQYDREMKTAEDEFNAKYEIFLSEQKSYAPAILRKRQSELEDMMKRNEQFRLESLRLLEKAHKEMLELVHTRINSAIAALSQLYQLAFVLNTDSDAVPYLNQSMAYDLTDVVIESLTNE